MRCVDILASFELEINKLDNALEKPVTDDSLYWINQAIMKFVKDRFNGNAPKRTSYEQNEKRTRDLIRLLCEKTTIEEGQESNYFLPENVVYFPAKLDFWNIDENKNVQWYETYAEDGSKEFVKKVDVYGDPSEDVGYKAIDFVHINTKHPSYDEYEYKYPKDMMFVLNEDVIISDLKDNFQMDTCIFECTADSFMYRVNNKLTDFHYRFHRARPLRVRTKEGFRLLTDKKYKINSYTLGYLRIPTELTNEDPYKDYTDFEDYTWLEITKIAA